jgi:hypothetical protein
VSTIEHQRQNSIASLRRHEAARDRVAKSKFVLVAIALEIVAEDEVEHNLEESTFVAEHHDHETEDSEIE